MFLTRIISPSTTRDPHFRSTEGQAAEYDFPCTRCGTRIELSLPEFIGALGNDRELGWGLVAAAKRHFEIGSVGKAHSGGWPSFQVAACPSCGAEYLSYADVHEVRNSVYEVTLQGVTAIQSQLAPVAYHEAGHAIVALFHGLNFTSVDLNPSGEERGGLRMNQAISYDVLVKDIEVRFAGPAAQAHFFGWTQAETDAMSVMELCWNGGGSDDAWAKWEAEQIVALEDPEQTLSVTERRNRIRECTENAKSAAIRYIYQVEAWAAVESIAAELLDKRKLSRGEIESILQEVRNHRTGRA